MLLYLGDLMEDAMDFSWQGAKAAHAILLCEMERGVFTWEDDDRIDRIMRAHAQKHVSNSRQNWTKGDSRKPSKRIRVHIAKIMRPMASMHVLSNFG